MTQSEQILLDVMGTACARWGVTPAEIRSNSHTRKANAARRQVAVVLTNMGWPKKQIAQALGVSVGAVKKHRKAMERARDRAVATANPRT